MKKSILILSMLFIVTMSFAQEIQKSTGKGGKFSLEKDGKVIVNENFDKVGSFIKEAGMIPAKLNGKWGFYDNDGKLAIPHQYDLLFCATTLDDWYIADRIQVGVNSRKFYIDKTGKEDPTLDYDAIEKVGRGVNAFYLRKNGKYALADQNRKPLTGLVYQIMQLKSLDPVSFTGVRDNKPYKVSANGEEMGESETTSSNSSSGKKDDKATSYTYKCQKCDKVTQGRCNDGNNGITLENCFAQQPDPKKGRKNHEWRKQ